MNWGAFDLNLLPVFDAVMQERSITRAGRRIGLSQPAMSHALGRLRHMLNDELFIRTPHGMAPTPRAELLAEPLRNALNEIQLAIEPPTFDPSASNRTFVLAINNYTAAVMAPSLVAAVFAAAPGITLDLWPSGTLNIKEGLDRGDLDFALCGLESPGERFRAEMLFKDPFVLVMRRGHPAGDRELSAADFANLLHLEISSSHEDTGFIDRWLEEQGLARRLALRAPYLSTTAILAQSDLVATMSRRIALQLARSHALQIREPPFDSFCARTLMIWHRRLDRHPAHRWLREMILAVTKSL